ncbi:MAG: type II toxin-antitoxin system HipA family toxin [Longimicrobiales bacterium]|nr:type II toxin-antitoxin system HipA family toxin [Longimicrobiales bacterium]
MADPVLAEVRLWGNRVGAVAEDEDGVITFEFDPSFAATALEISPIHLPLSLQGPVRFPELRRLEAFGGLPGVLADSLPDRFGNAVIRRYFEEKGTPGLEMSPVQKLLYIGSRAMGALEFRPPLETTRRGNELPLEVEALVSQARYVIEGRTDVSVPGIIRVGSSAGGMRPKALVLFDETTGLVRSGHARPRVGETHWILKFDGIQAAGSPYPGGGIRTDQDPLPYMKIEHCYTRMARMAGIDAVETRLLRERGYSHLLVRRFDRVGTERIHQHTLGGLQHIDYNQPGAFSYDDYLRTILRLNLGYPALEEGFRRVAFNVAAGNQDDHVKNLSFLLDPSGGWRLSPAYDLTFAMGEGFTRRHQMSVGEKRTGITPEDLRGLARKFGIEKDGQDAMEAISAALAHWEARASSVGLEERRIEAVAEVFRARGFVGGGC